MKKLNHFICYSLILLFAFQGAFVSTTTKSTSTYHDTHFKVHCIASPRSG